MDGRLRQGAQWHARRRRQSFSRATSIVWPARECLDRILDTVASLGAPSEALGGDETLRELVAKSGSVDGLNRFGVLEASLVYGCRN